MRARDINDEMKVAAAYAIAGLVSDEELNPEYIIPNAFDERVGKTVAKAVREAAVKTGAALSEGPPPGSQDLYADEKKRL